tara:strand:+ start:36 stop:422 length:387 start_codon:yes stop_codon:yes gene_type:complete
MSINNLSNDLVTSLFQPLIISELSNQNIIDKIKSDAANYSKLKLLAQQAHFLKSQIDSVIQEGILNNNLHEVSCRFKKISGNYYYLYQKDNLEYYFSMLSPYDWNNNPPHTFIAKYLYDFDKCFRIIS